jgi:hypothetical protein
MSTVSAYHTTRQHLTNQTPFCFTTGRPICLEGDTLKIDTPNEEVEVEIIGTGLHIFAFGGMHIDEPVDAKWYLTIQYYMFFQNVDAIHLIEAMYTFLHYHPIMIFIIQNQLHPHAPLEISYYQIVLNDRYDTHLYILFRVALPEDGPTVGQNGNLLLFLCHCRNSRYR